MQRTRIWLAGLACGLLIATSIVTGMLGAQREQRAVPNVVGNSAVVARSALTAAGFDAELVVAARPAPTEQHEFSVALQEPAAGTPQEVGTRIRLQIYPAFDPQRLAGAVITPGEGELLVAPAPEHGSIDARTGALELAVTDISLPAGPVRFEFIRSLRSDNKSHGQLGARWQTNWESRLLTSGDLLIVDEWSGPKPYFKTGGDGNYANLRGERVLIQDDVAIRLLNDGSREFFDGRGRLIARDQRNGNTFVLRYDESDHLARIDGPFQSWMTFDTDARGRTVRIETSTGSRVDYRYENAELLVARPQRGTAFGYTYDAVGHLVSIHDPICGLVRLVYDSEGRVIRRQWADQTHESWEYSERTVTAVDRSGSRTTTTWSPDETTRVVTDPLGRKTTLESDDLGRPVRLTGPSGNSTTWSYDSLGRMIRSQSSINGTSEIKYHDDTWNIAEVVLPNGMHRYFDFDTNGNLTKTHGDELNRDCQDTTIEYSPRGLVTAKTSCNGGTTQYVYDNSGQLVRSVDASGAAISYEYDSSGNLVTETDATGGVTRAEYDQRGNLIRAINPAGEVTRYVYTNSGQLSQVIEPGDAVTQFRYDSDAIITTDPVGRTSRLQYHPNGQIAAQTDGAGHTTRYDYDQVGNLTRITYPSGTTETREYDALNRLLNHTDTAGRITRYTYSPAGQLVTRSTSSGEEVTFRYDVQGRLLETTGSNGDGIRRQFTPDGQSIQYLSAHAPPELYVYNTDDEVTEIRRGEQVLVSYEYDDFRRLIREHHAGGLVLTYTYDDNGNLRSWNDNHGGRGTFRYDELGRVTTAADSLGGSTRYRYDSAGRVAAVTDPLGGESQFTYNDAGDLIQVSGANGDIARYEYDLAGRVSAVHAPDGGKTAFQYDPMGNLVGIVDPLGNQQTRVYDASGRIVKTTDGEGQATECTYDDSGRLAQLKLADGRTVEYTYDAHGNLTGIDDGVYPIRYQYDQLGRRKQIDYPAVKRSLKYAYDQDGRLDALTDSEDQVSHYTYDDFGRLKTIELDKAGVFRFAYDDRDNLTELLYPNGVRGTWEYDGAERVTEIRYSSQSGNILAGWKYEYDLAGRRTRTHDLVSDSVTHFEFDRAGQIIREETDGGPRILYEYGPGGHRKVRSADGVRVEYQYDLAGRLVQAGADQMAYDKNGNLIERRGPNGVTTYGFDAIDQLVSVTHPDGDITRFRYAPNGERVLEQRDGETFHLLGDGRNLLTRLDKNLQPIGTYQHGVGLDTPLMINDQSQRFYLLAEATGTIRAVMDGQGQVVRKLAYDAFGNSQTPADPDAHESISVFQFAGRPFDVETGLYFLRARYYSPGDGRFLSPDPILGETGNVGSLNAYSYAMNNPVTYSDPLGLQPQPTRITLGGRDYYVLYRGHRTPVSGTIQSPVARQYGRAESYQTLLRQMNRLQPGGKPMGLRGTIVAHQNSPAGSPFVAMSSEHSVAARPNFSGPGGEIVRIHVPVEEVSPNPWGTSPPRQPGRVYPAPPNLGRHEAEWVIEGEIPDEWIFRRRPFDPTGGRPRASSSRPGLLSRGLNRLGNAVRGLRNWIRGSKSGGPSGGVNNQTAGPQPTGARGVKVAGAAAAGLLTGLNYHACREEGHSHAHCLKEFGVGAVVGLGLVGVISLTGPAAPFILGGLGAYGAYATGTRVGSAWQLQENLQQFGHFRSRFDAEVAQIRALQQQTMAARAAAIEHARTAQKQLVEATSQLAKLKAIESQVKEAAALCQSGNELKQQIETLAAKAERNLDLVGRALDWADAAAGDIQSPEQASKILQMFENAKGLVLGIASEATRAEARNTVLSRILERAQTARALAASASKTAAQIGAAALQAGKSADAAASEKQKALALEQQLTTRIKTLLAALNAARGMFPLHLPAVRQADIHGKLDTLLASLADAAQLPALDISAYHTGAQSAAAVAKEAVSEAQSLLTTIGQYDLCDELQPADGAVDRADAALKLALLRLAASADLPELVKDWLQVDVPGLVGLKAPAAKAKLEAVGLAMSLEAASEKPASKEEEYTVTTQAIPAGETVERGTTVGLEVLPAFGDDDETAPTITIDSPQNGQIAPLGKSVQVAVRATDDTALSQIRLSVSGASVAAGPANPVRTFPADTKDSKSQIFTFTVAAEGVNESNNTITITASATDSEAKLTTQSVTVKAGGTRSDLLIKINPTDPQPNQNVHVTVSVLNATEGTQVQYSVSGTDGYKAQGTPTVNDEGTVSFGIPGAKKGVVDSIEVKIIGSEPPIVRKAAYTF